MNTRLPASILKARGSFKINPGRKRVDPEAQGKLGQPPKYFTPSQKAIWKELKEILPKGLCKSADRWVCEVACVLMDEFRHDELKATLYQQLMSALSRLGLSPVDRARCSVPVSKASKEDNEFAEI
jgi:phage terminase small subunit